MKLFKRSPKLHHCLNLIRANHDGNIIFSEKLPHQIQWFIHRIIDDNCLYEDDKAYIAIYKEYKAHYVMYDLYPLLLYFRIPLVIAAQYRHIDFAEPHDYLLSDNELKRGIPSQVRIPKGIKDLLIESFNEVRAYIDQRSIDSQDVEDFDKYLEFKFLLEWPEYWNSPEDYINTFGDRILHRFIRFAGENKQTVKNIIERTLQRNIEEASSN